MSYLSFIDVGNITGLQKKQMNKLFLARVPVGDVLARVTIWFAGQSKRSVYRAGTISADADMSTQQASCKGCMPGYPGQITAAGSIRQADHSRVPLAQ